MAAFVMYDLSNLEKTLCTIVEWKKMINNTVCMENGDPIPVYLLGNKVNIILLAIYVTRFAKRGLIHTQLQVSLFTII